jgi:hypothetical protein
MFSPAQKNASISIFAISLKLITGFLIGLTFSLIGQELMSYGSFSFVLMMVVTMGLVYRLLQSWTVSAVLVFDLICVLMALLLRMYILIAP